MKAALRILALGMLLLVPIAAYAQAPSVSAISDVTLNAGATVTVNVVAVSLVGDAITLTPSLPAFCTLNSPTTGTGLVITTLTLSPTASDVGTFAASVTATAGSLTDVETFQITVNAAGSNVAPVVVAPATQTGTEGSAISFTVTASDADADLITTLAADGVPTGATFTPNGTNTSGTFSWTPSLTQAGDYDVVFTATNALSGAATTHIHVNEAVVITPISDLTVAEGGTATVNVNVTGPATGTISLTSSLPAFATLNSPTSSTGTGTLSTTISIAPGAGTAGSYPSSVTATATVGDQQVTENFTIIVTTAGGGAGPTARMLGQFNTHRKFICFRVQPNGSFDARNVDLSSVHLVFNGLSLTPLSSRTKIDLDCDDDDGDEGDCDRGEDCEECNNGDDDHDGDTDTTGCVATLRACFSTGDLVTFFGDASLPGALANATVEGSLTTGGTFVATFDASKLTHHDNGHHGLNIKARPNPLNPATRITFTLSQPGRVRVGVYDMQGRLVSKLLDENRAAGEQTLSWDGSNSRNQRVASGVYFFRIEAPEGRDFKQLSVLK